VSWESAQSFINTINESNDGFIYRLPTEAEWEYACRAGTTGDYYEADVDDISWYSGNSGSVTHAVGKKHPNAFGLYDMSGNAWEWCEDWYHETYDEAPTDGRAWLTGGEQKLRVLRGGSWLSDARQSRSAYRYNNSPDSRSDSFGFRFVAVKRN
jgi:formylglycine-generating enzyme required for sulfatase activity